MTSAVANGELVIETDGLTKRYDEALVLGALAFWTFHRRDVQGATGGG